MKRSPTFMGQHCENGLLPKNNPQFQYKPFKIPTQFLKKIKKIFNLIWKHKTYRIAKTILNNRRNAEQEGTNGENAGTNTWNWGTFHGSGGNPVHWKFHELYESNSSHDS